MSGQLELPFEGAGGLQKQSPAEAIRESIAREMRYLIAIAKDASRPFAVKPTGVAYSLGVCLIEDFNMARGKGKGAERGSGAGMPRFVDVKLTADQRGAFKEWLSRGGDLVRFLQSLADDGYRVGVSWSGEQQAYTVSLTCRDSESVNAGLCMTSFAKSLETALWLALYKHHEVTGGRWVEGAFGEGEEYG